MNGTQLKKAASQRTGPPSPPREERLNSMMSQATYVLANDKRKPLLVQSGLQVAILANKQQTLPVKKSKSKEK
jgi:hypothetical protein